MRATMRRSTAAGRSLVVATLLVLLAGQAEGRGSSGGSGGFHRSTQGIQLTVAPDSKTEKLVCTVTKAMPPAGKGGISVRITVPRDSTLKSALLKTASGQLDLELTSAMSSTGPYATIIDGQKLNCPTAGTMVLVVEGEFDTSTVGCPEISLFRANACDESSSGNE
jgi:hypothetical protein